jgi:hypothetical protein
MKKTYAHDTRWPRTTVGALMDCDISLTCYAYDGTSVRIAPRAVMALTTMACAVTPLLCGREAKSARIIKCISRGFKQPTNIPLENISLIKTI